MTPLGDYLAQGTSRYFQPQMQPGLRRRGTEVQIQRRLASLVGLVAFGLPIVLALGALLGGGCFRDSISHFYYAQFLGPVFVGMLIFIGGFMIAYTGEHWLEDAGSFVAGLGACFVALFPTSGSGCERQTPFLTRAFVDYTASTPPVLTPAPGGGLFQLFPHVEHLHSWAAAILFVYLGLYCLIVLKRVIPARHMAQGHLIASKRRRNQLYTLCGVTILLCVAVLGAKGLLLTEGALKTRWNTANLTFVFETLALWAFGLAWMAKGRRLGWLNDPTATTGEAP